MVLILWMICSSTGARKILPLLQPQLLPNALFVFGFLSPSYEPLDFKCSWMQKIDLYALLLGRSCFNQFLVRKEFSQRARGELTPLLLCTLGQDPFPRIIWQYFIYYNLNGCHPCPPALFLWCIISSFLLGTLGCHMQWGTKWVLFWTLLDSWFSVTGGNWASAPGGPVIVL